MICPAQRTVRVIILLTLLSSVAAAETRRFGNVVYDPPTGWRVGVPNEQFVTVSSDANLHGVYAEIRIYQGTAASGRLENWVRGIMARELAVEKQTLDKDLPAKQQAGVNGPVLFFPRYTKDRGRRMQLYAAMQLNDRFELCRFDGPADNEVETPKCTELLSRDFQPMFESLRFISTGASRLEPAAKPGSLNGVWFGTRLVNSTGYDGRPQVGIARSLYTFYPDGEFFAGVPDSGITKLDYQSAARLQTGCVGTYFDGNDQITLCFADGLIRTLKKTGINDNFIDAGTRIQQVQIPPKGFTFSGILRKSFAAGFRSGMDGRGVAASESIWTFAKDGTFESTSTSAISADSDNGSSFASSSPSSTGKFRYSVDDGIITLRLGEEKPFSWPVFLIASESGNQVVVDGYVLNSK